MSFVVNTIGLPSLSLGPRIKRIGNLSSLPVASSITDMVRVSVFFFSTLEIVGRKDLPCHHSLLRDVSKIVPPLFLMQIVAWGGLIQFTHFPQTLEQSRTDFLVVQELSCLG